MDFEQDDMFKELSQEELNRYIEEMAGGSEEYIKKQKADRIFLKISEIKKHIKQLSDSCEEFRRQYKMNSSVNLTSYLTGMQLLYKKIGECLYWFGDNISDVEDYKTGISLNPLMDSRKIKIEEYNGIYRILLPSLIPHKKMKQMIPDYAINYRTPILEALFGYFGDTRPKLGDKACMVIIHCFKDGDRVVDYDNFDYTHLINCLASYFLIDDDPEHYTLHVAGSKGNESHSEIFISNKENLKNIWDMCERIFNV